MINSAFTFDPLSAEFARNPYPAYAALRAQEGPVHHAPFDVWLLSRHADVTAAATNPTFVRSLEPVFDPAEIARQKIAQNWHDMPHHARFVQFSLLDSDGAVHDRLRRLVFRAFTPARIAQQRAAIQGFVDRLLDRLLAGGPIDFVEDLAAQVPGHVIGAMLGVPGEHVHRLRTWSDDIVQFFDVDRSDDRKRRAETATSEFYHYLVGLIAQRESAPRDDLLGTLVLARQAGTMSEDELISTCMLILMAGHGSSIDMLGSGLHLLLRFPAAMQALRDDPRLIATTIQEMFRYEAPLPFFHRYLTEDAVVAGRMLPKGAKIGLLYGAANRDPAMFDQADRFDIGRAPNRHLAFGSGAHVCLGNHLARLDMEIVFTTLLRRTRAIDLAGDAPAYKRGLSVRGPIALPVRIIQT
jgi:cytochrome P450